MDVIELDDAFAAQRLGRVIRWAPVACAW
jgi:hypothetical protein